MSETSASPSSNGELVLEFDAPLEVAQWRPLVHWLLVIPQMIVAGVLYYIAELLAIVSFFTVLFGKNVLEGVYNFQVMALRYQWRVSSYQYWMREPYPPFTFDMVQADPGTDQARLSISRPDEMDRWRCIQGILLIPQIIVLLFVSIAAFVVLIISWFAVLFTGTYPEGMRTFLVGWTRWANRVFAYGLLMSDKYPPFSLE